MLARTSSTFDPRTLSPGMGQNRRMRARAFLFALLGMLLALGGCQPATVIGGGIPPTKRYRTIASLSPSTTEIVASNIYTITLVGKTAQCNYPTMKVGVPIVMNGVKPNYERLAQIRPMAIVYDESLFTQADIDKLKGLGADPASVNVRVVAAPPQPDGKTDPESRVVSIRVSP